MDVRFHNICYQIPAKKSLSERLPRFISKRSEVEGRSLLDQNILQDVSGYVGEGESLAIMGPSGSGKTSLLNLLAGRSQYSASSGTILFGGRPRVPRTKRYVGYVMQDDVFFSKLTVRETLEFTASIRIPDSVSHETKMKRIDDILSRLRLTKCQNTHIGDQQFDKGISGGERKRLNVANELIHDPKLLLADECTSGLDSSSAYDVINFLHELCSEGKTVIATIHQPSSKVFLMFSKVLLLAAGRVAFFGPPSCVEAYFERLDFPFPGAAYNPADFMMELIIDDHSGPSPEDGVTAQSRILEAWNSNGEALVSSLQDVCSGRNVRNQKQSVQVEGETAVTLFPEEQIYSDESQSTEDETSQEDASSDSDIAKLAWDGKARASNGKEPPPQSSILGRVIRATKKRARDITGRHNASGEMDKYPTNWFSQALALSRRAMNQKRGVLVQPISLIWVLCIIIISGSAWFRMKPTEGTIEDRLGFLSFVCVFWSFQTTAASIFAFPAERKVLHKDRAGGSYRLSAYYFTKTMVETPADMLYPLLYSAATYFVVGLNPSFQAFLLFTVVLIANVLTAQSIGLLVSTLVRDVRHAQVFGTLWILFAMLTSGYHIDPDNTPSFIEPFRYASFIKYSYEAMVRIEMIAGRTFSCVTEDSISTIYSQGGQNCPVTMSSLLHGAQLENSLSIGANIGILIAWILGIRLMGYFTLKLLHATHKPKFRKWRTH